MTLVFSAELAVTTNKAEDKNKFAFPASCSWLRHAFTLNKEIQEYLFHLQLNIVRSIFFSQFQLFLFISDIMNKKPQLAWKLYLKMETSGDSFNLLQLIANDCYKVSFLFSEILFIIVINSELSFIMAGCLIM